MIFSTTTAKLEHIASGLGAISEEKISFPVKVSYRIIRNRLLIEQALSAYRMTKDELVNRYSNGKGVVKEKDDPKLFEELCMNIADIGLEKIEVDISTISLDDIKEMGTIPLNIMSAISFMLKE